ncbi:ABC1 family protein, putative [Babesia ovata]|uniref:ABC1 family protein, putative n=1 Tax=Babesia ovata TaxID=189622 RepID=A0A2H6K7M5_9APIC|nr:ABC1 family protein, putative [Babesia ovata]GBE58997.1 ABC1 family protein, putative [Babesia ovata]
MSRAESMKDEPDDSGRSSLQRSMDVFWAVSNLSVEWNKKLLMGSFIPSEKKDRYWKESNLAMAQMIVDSIKNLKGCWVKVGQILSTKPGMLPRCYVEALSQLQDRMGHSDFSEIIDTLEEELGYMDDIFKNFDSIPIASASIAQVHKAMLHDGHVVAIKVQHKCSEQNLRNDLEILKMILWVAQSMGTYQRMFASIDDYTAAALQEIDFKIEAESCRLAGVDAEVSGIPIVVPRVFDKYCSKRVITMEFFELYKMTDVKFFQDNNIDASGIVYDIQDFAIYQILSSGKFHGDPHPGNVLLTRSKVDNKFYPVLLDWGMTQSLTTKQRIGLCHLTYAMCIGDTIGCFMGFVEAGFDMTAHKDFSYERFLESLLNIFSSDFSKVMDFCAEDGSMNLVSEDEKAGEWHYQGRIFIKDFIINAPNFFPILLKVVSEYRNYAITLKVRLPFLQILYKNSGNALYNVYYTPLLHLMSSESNKAKFLRKARRVKQVLSADCVEVTDEQVVTKVLMHVSTSMKSKVRLSEPISFRKPRCLLEAKVSAFLTHIAKDSSLLVAAQVCVIRNGAVEVDLAHGSMGRYECRPVNSVALFQVSHMMNGLIATAVLNLTTHYDVSLDDPISKHWPEFGQNDKEQVTIREMLNHSSGLVMPYPNILLIENLDYETMIKDIQQANLHKEAIGMTNYGYLYFGWIMGELVRRVTGKTVEEYILGLARDVSVPLGQLVFPSLPLNSDVYRPEAPDNDGSYEVVHLDATSAIDLDEQMIEIPLGSPNWNDSSEDSTPAFCQSPMVALDAVSPLAGSMQATPAIRSDVNLNDSVGSASKLVVPEPNTADDKGSGVIADKCTAALKSKATSLVDLHPPDTRRQSSEDLGEMMGTIVDNGKEIPMSKFTMIQTQGFANKGLDSSGSHDMLDILAPNITQPNSPGNEFAGAEKDVEYINADATVDIKEVLMSKEEFFSLPQMSETLPTAEQNIEKAKTMKASRRRRCVGRMLQRLGAVAREGAETAAPQRRCWCTVTDDSDELTYHRCFYPSNRCPVETRFVRNHRTPFLRLDDLDVSETEKMANQDLAEGTNGRYDPVLVSDSDVVTDDDELSELDLMDEKQTLSRLRLRKFIMKRQPVNRVFHHSNYDVFNYRCIITDPMAMEYEPIYQKSVPGLNGRASAVALSRFYQAVLDGTLVDKRLLAEAERTVAVDRSIVTKMITALYTPAWGLGYQRFYLQRQGSEEMLIGLGTVDVSGSLTLMVPKLKLVVTMLFSCTKSVALSHSLLSLVLGHYGLKLAHANLNNLERAHERLVDAHHGARVVELPAIIRGTKKRDQTSLGKKFVTVLHHLMGAADEVEFVLDQKVDHDVGAERERNSSVIFSPPRGVRVRITPKKVAEKAGVRHVSWSRNLPDLVHGVQLRRETAVHAKYLIVNDRSHRQAVEAVREHLPKLHAVAALALVVKSVDAVDGRTLMVTAQQEKVLRADGLQRLLSSVDVVPKEEVVRGRREAAVLEKAQQIIVLPMNVSADFDRCFQLQEHRLRQKDLAALEAETADLLLAQLHATQRPIALHFEQALDDIVYFQFHIKTYIPYRRRMRFRARPGAKFETPRDDPTGRQNLCPSSAHP